jgi:hypothetical protein
MPKPLQISLPTFRTAEDGLMPLGFHPHPGGMRENSPTLQRAEALGEKFEALLSPEGTAQSK